MGRTWGRHSGSLGSPQGDGSRGLPKTGTQASKCARSRIWSETDSPPDVEMRVCCTQIMVGACVASLAGAGKGLARTLSCLSCHCRAGRRSWDCCRVHGCLCALWGAQMAPWLDRAGGADATEVSEKVIRCNWGGHGDLPACAGIPGCRVERKRRPTYRGAKGPQPRGRERRNAWDRFFIPPGVCVWGGSAIPAHAGAGRGIAVTSAAAGTGKRFP